MLLRDGRTVDDPRTDRIPEHDPRSRQFQVRDVLTWGKAIGADLGSRVKPRANRPAKPGLNQGNLGGCVLWSAATGLDASPHRRRPPLTDDNARAWYYDVQRADEYPGGEYPGAAPVAGGTSLVAAARHLHHLGLLSSYWWCGAGSGSAIDDVVDSLAAPDLGGVQLGIPWFDSMYQPLPSGLLEVEPDSGQGGPHGYHAIWALAFRYAPIAGHGTAKREHVVVQQTWGPWGIPWFGVHGHALVLVDDLEAKLLPAEVYGEAMVPVTT